MRPGTGCSCPKSSKDRNTYTSRPKHNVPGLDVIGSGGQQFQCLVVRVMHLIAALTHFARLPLEYGIWYEPNNDKCLRPEESHIPRADPCLRTNRVQHVQDLLLLDDAKRSQRRRARRILFVSAATPTIVRRSRNIQGFAGRGSPYLPGRPCNPSSSSLCGGTVGPSTSQSYWGYR
jgi:hypothetical protein